LIARYGYSSVEDVAASTGDEDFFIMRTCDILVLEERRERERERERKLLNTHGLV